VVRVRKAELALRLLRRNAILAESVGGILKWMKWS
jgi:hypothetical protein